MNEVNFATLDLNLIRVFLAIWDTRNLTAAGERLHLTQPAVSHALRRLRDDLGDPLFVRSVNAMIPTDGATRLEPPLRQAFSLIQKAVQEGMAFDPAHTQRVFRIAMSDVSEFVLLPPVLAEVERRAPGIRIESVRIDPAVVGGQLRTGDVDLALGYLPGLEEGCVSELLGRDSFVCLVREDHPVRLGRLDPVSFGQMRYVYAGPEAPGHQMAESWLDVMGVQRTVALRLAHFTIAPEVVRNTDLAVIFPRSMGERVNHAGGFRLIELPDGSPHIEVKVYTHSHFASDQGIRWLRDIFLSERGWSR